MSEIITLKCPECGHKTQVSWKNRRGHPRYCRHCGAQIAESMDKTRYVMAPVIMFKCNHPELCAYNLDCRVGEICCISCHKENCPYECRDALSWWMWPSDEPFEICEDLEVVITPRQRVICGVCGAEASYIGENYKGSTWQCPECGRIGREEEVSG